MNRDSITDLLDEACATLRDRLAPALQGEQRYLALLTANAVATARREVAMRTSLEAAETVINVPPADIRAGRHDEDSALYESLLHHAMLRSWIADPASLTADEKRQLDIND